MTWRTLKALLAITALFHLSASADAFAYSYGEKEDPMAIVFKTAVASAREGKWDETLKQADNGVALQKGHSFPADSLAPKIKEAAEKKDVSRTAELFANMAYLSIREKLHRNIKEGAKDFKSSKARLSMARKTYLDVLDGNVKKQDTERSKAILSEFDKALAALGNPGIFGAGKKPYDPAESERAVKSIETLIEKSFPSFTN